MVEPENGTVVGKADTGKMKVKEEAEKGVTTYAEDILDPPLYHVFANILKLALDDRHSKFCALFAEHCPT